MHTKHKQPKDRFGPTMTSFNVFLRNSFFFVTKRPVFGNAHAARHVNVIVLVSPRRYINCLINYYYYCNTLSELNFFTLQLYNRRCNRQTRHLPFRNYELHMQHMYCTDDHKLLYCPMVYSAEVIHHHLCYCSTEIFTLPNITWILCRITSARDGLFAERNA